MSPPVLEVAGVSKRFRYRPYLPGALTLKSAVLDALLLRARPAPVTVEALVDVSLVAAPGEAVGIVGPNGAGKSTLLRLIAGAYRPDAGRVVVRGRAGLLLEPGAGFHPELSGLENAEIAALLAGLGQREARARLDAIAAFAELDGFLHAPLRTYSAGMAMRLGFAVAQAVEPALLVVDEVLAVGDRRFQERCLERIAALRAGGTALVLASHDLGAVEGLCDRALLLERGRVVASGPAREVTARYREGAPGAVEA